MDAVNRLDLTGTYKAALCNHEQVINKDRLNASYTLSILKFKSVSLGAGETTVLKDLLLVQRTQVSLKHPHQLAHNCL